MDETELDLKTLLSTFRRRWRLIVLTFAIVVGVALIATFALTPKYTASAQIYVDVQGRDLLDPATETVSASTASFRVDSEVEIARSKKVLLNVVSDLDLVRDAEFGVRLGLGDKITGWLGLPSADLPSGTDALNRVMAELDNAISVSRLGLTFLIDISATSADPERAATLANAVANAYIAAQVSAKVEEYPHGARHSLQSPDGSQHRRRLCRTGLRQLYRRQYRHHRRRGGAHRHRVAARRIERRCTIDRPPVGAGHTHAAIDFGQ